MPRRMNDDLKDRLAIITVTTRCVTIIRSFNVDAVFHRRDAIYPATVVGKPRQEDFFIGDYLQKLLSPLFPMVMPSVRDLWTYGETGFHSLCAAVVRERYGREALVSGFRILGEGQLSLTKFLMLTDTPQDLKDFPAFARTRARALPAGDGSVRVFKRFDGHARLHEWQGERRQQGDHAGVG